MEGLCQEEYVDRFCNPKNKKKIKNSMELFWRI